MSKNSSALSFRKGGIEKNYFERMVESAEETGTATGRENVRALSEEYPVGEAITLGAVSAYDFLKKENEGKKVHVCNGSACLVARTQNPSLLLVRQVGSDRQRRTAILLHRMRA